jgi:hypothetical protein
MPPPYCGSSAAGSAATGRPDEQYLAAVQDALAGAEAARVVLAGVVKRLEGR